jgi:hypothetical protein
MSEIRQPTCFISDYTVMTTDMAWAEKIKVGRNIGDFCEWRCKGGYKKGLMRLLRGLRRG